MKVKAATLVAPSLVVLNLVSVNLYHNRAKELFESRGDRAGLPVPNSPYGLCGRKVTLY